MNSYLNTLLNISRSTFLLSIFFFAASVTSGFGFMLFLLVDGAGNVPGLIDVDTLGSVVDASCFLFTSLTLDLDWDSSFDFASR